MFVSSCVINIRLYYALQYCSMTFFYQGRGGNFMGRENLVFRGPFYNFQRHNISFLVVITYRMLEMSVTEAALKTWCCKWWKLKRRQVLRASQVQGARIKNFTGPTGKFPESRWATTPLVSIVLNRLQKHDFVRLFLYFKGLARKAGPVGYLRKGCKK